MAKTIKTAVAEEAEKSLSIEESFARLDEILEKIVE
jgi:hypothetical protein